MNKKIISIFLLYGFQFMATSCDPCDCPTSKTFEKRYNGLELKAWDTSGFQIEEVSGPVNKNSFGLTISVVFGLNQIAYAAPKLTFSSFGFMSAYACDCIFDKYINVDPIDAIAITATNTLTDNTTDVTDHFTTYGYDGERVAISALFEDLYDGRENFQIDMTERRNIPDSAIFIVQITLESGKELVAQTQEIHFE